MAILYRDGLGTMGVRRKRPNIVRFLFIGIAIAVIGLILWQGRGIISLPVKPASRSVELTETLTIPQLPSYTWEARIWLPSPPVTEFQSVELVKIESPIPYVWGSEPEFENRYIEFTSRGLPALPATIRVTYRMTRTEQTGLATTAGATTESSSITHPVFLQPRGYIAITEKLARVALEQTDGLVEPLERAHALYDYTLRHVQFDPDAAGAGRGSSLYALEAGRGDSADMHALFIALARSVNIPARFHTGVTLGASSSGILDKSNRRSWAEFYAEPRGWVPVDIAAAWMEQNKKEYYFGSIDPNRLHISTGRHLRVAGTHVGPGISLWGGPYIEINYGIPIEQFEFTRQYKNI